jgi:hypothetical protein
MLARDESEGGEFIFERVLDAPPDRVFRAWTDPEGLARWWGPKGFTNPLCEVDARPGGAIRIHMRSPGGKAHCHPFIIGELACGNLSRRREILGLLGNLPDAPVAEHREVLEFVEAHRLMGSGIGWVDAHLLVSAALGGMSFWTLDRRLEAISRRLRLHF